ncbi:TetR/AcrR family transcriptional regulator [Megasphaera elsdenii]|uniref:Transcriptional regulator NfxB n=1 Tax=Megasphaera elsdenii TaxID=907 RepID=A0A848EU43_MEGEL|nr:TetR/AcrR family transcriptional regulator [Megasphaera elsdenii]NMK39352.1 transcriptional regulator NfxB [Megasphaera elsdenii]
MNINTHDEQLLKKLAVALSANPRGTTRALAEAAGISRATFNRFCGSRENLMEMIGKQAETALQEIIRLAQKKVEDYEATLLSLIEVHLKNQEYLIFVCGTQSSLENIYWENYLEGLDKFFLNGQKAGKFRLEFSNQMLTELFVSIICGMIDAEGRSRVAASGIEKKMAAFFLNGVAE